jgi:hypothetical protein
MSELYREVVEMHRLAQLEKDTIEAHANLQKELDEQVRGKKRETMRKVRALLEEHFEKGVGGVLVLGPGHALVMIGKPGYAKDDVYSMKYKDLREGQDD